LVSVRDLHAVIRPSFGTVFQSKLKIQKSKLIDLTATQDRPMLVACFSPGSPLWAAL
jgi:hypothetical protein